jgi:hypothetical protein
VGSNGKLDGRRIAAAASVGLGQCGHKIFLGELSDQAHAAGTQQMVNHRHDFTVIVRGFGYRGYDV